MLEEDELHYHLWKICYSLVLPFFCDKRVFRYLSLLCVIFFLLNIWYDMLNNSKYKCPSTFGIIPLLVATLSYLSLAWPMYALTSFRDVLTMSNISQNEDINYNVTPNCCVKILICTLTWLIIWFTQTKRWSKVG